ncbi:MAG TPA: carboxymuconolactone decarboxylase family protein, partial [Candidatus Binatia bacterium]|nr:carboxymuconolactone decarboxylase family protein [Candidatus Binatia bacterium]
SLPNMKEDSLMPRISLVPVEAMEGQVKEAAQMLQAALGVVPHSFRTYAHRPEIALAFAHLAQAVLGTGTLDRKLKTMVAYKVSTTNGCPYCIGHTSGMLHEAGFAQKDLDGIKQLDLGLFSEKEQLALRFAEQATREPARVSDELVAQLRQHFSEGEVVEIAAVVGLMNFTNKVHEALALPLEEKFLH